MTDADRRNAQDDLHTSRALNTLGQPFESMLVWLTPAERDADLNILDVLILATTRQYIAMQTLREGTE